MEVVREELFTIYNNFLEVLEYRKTFDTSEYKYNEETFFGLRERDSKLPYSIKLIMNFEDKNLVLYFVIYDLSVDIVLKLAADIKKTIDKSKHFVLIHNNKAIPSKAKAELLLIREQKGIKIEQFSFNDLIISKISKNPPMEIATKEEVYKLIQDYNADSKDNLPKILSTSGYCDPMIKVLGAEKGDVIKIYRERQVAKEKLIEIYYRVVV